MKSTDARSMLRSEQERARAKIPVGRAIAAITRIMDGEDMSDPPEKQARIAAAKLLLAKALPDMSSVDINAQVEGTITITINKIT